MHLRDKSAIAALQGLLANPQNWTVESEVLASAAYKHADAMIAEREKELGNVVLTQAEFRHLRGELIDCKSQLQAILEASKR